MEWYEYAIVITLMVAFTSTFVWIEIENYKENKKQKCSVFDTWMHTHDCDWIEFEIECNS